MKALEGSPTPHSNISISKRTGRHIVQLPSKAAIKIPHPEVLTIAVDVGGDKTKVAIMTDAHTVEVFTLPPYVYMEDIPRGASRQRTRAVEPIASGISAMLTTTTDDSNEEVAPPRTDNLSFERKGKRIIGGKGAGDLGGRTGLGQSKLELLEEKVIMALIMAGVKPDSEFKLSVALPGKKGTFEREQSQVPIKLKRLAWTQDNAYNPSAKLIKTVPEGAHGHLYPLLVNPSLPDFSKMPDFSKIKHANFDGGWREMKVLAFDTSNLGQPSGTQSGVLEVGINEAYKRVAEQIGEENHESPEFVLAVNEALKLGSQAPKYYVRAYSQSVDLSEDARIIFDDYQEEYIEEAFKLIPPGYHHFCLFGGVMHHYGEALGEEIEARTGGECWVMDPCPEFVNAICQVVDLACS